jgi:glycosyltransferase involved in cell wall biosynthesis
VSDAGTSSWRDDPNWPDVDVVLPIRNEAPTLAAAIESIRAQEYAGRLRIFIGMAPSDDDTAAVATELAAGSDDVVVVPNPAGTTPAGLNAAIRAGSSPVIVRVDGHSRLSAGYVERAVEVLRETGAANVGGTQRPEPTTPFEGAVADATTSWLGTGGARYRVGSVAGPTDTVYLGVFDRAAISEVGLFDESLIRNQDYELNIRLRAAGDTVWFEPTLFVGYRPRGSWSALARQYFEYGQWKSVVMRRHPSATKWRQLVPPLGMLGVVGGLVVGSRWRPALVVPAMYAIAVGGTAARSARPALTAGVLVTIHAEWAGGLVLGLTRPA